MYKKALLSLCLMLITISLCSCERKDDTSNKTQQQSSGHHYDPHHNNGNHNPDCHH